MCKEREADEEAKLIGPYSNAQWYKVKENANIFILNTKWWLHSFLEDIA